MIPQHKPRGYVMGQAGLHGTIVPPRPVQLTVVRRPERKPPKKWMTWATAVKDSIWEANGTTFWDYEIRRYGQQYQLVILFKDRFKAKRRLSYPSLEEAKEAGKRWEEASAATTGASKG